MWESLGIHVSETKMRPKGEYYYMLNEFEVELDDRYIFKPINVNYNVPDGT